MNDDFQHFASLTAHVGQPSVQLSSPLTSGGFLPRIHFPSAMCDQLSLLTVLYEEKMLFVHKHGNKEVNCFVRVHGDASKVISP